MLSQKCQYMQHQIMPHTILSLKYHNLELKVQD